MSKSVRWMLVTDTHGDQLDRGAWSVAREFAAYWKPDIRIHAGDVFDFRYLRRGARDEEKAEEVKQDYDAGCDLLREWKPTHVLWGNHDHRLWRAFRETTNGALKELCRLYIDGIADTVAGARCYEYDKRKGVMQLGNHRVIHGFVSGVNATRKTAETYGNVLLGHNHRKEMASVDRLDRATGYSVGCLCNLDMPYNAGHLATLKQTHGFAYGILTKRQNLVVWLASPEDGTWYLPSEMVEKKVTILNSSAKPCQS